MKSSAASSLPEDVGDGPAQGGAVQSPFPDDDDALPLAGLVFGKAAVEAVLLAVLRPDVAAEIGAVHFDGPAGAADLDALGLRRHRLTDLVGQHERGLVLDVQVARQRERALALDLVEEDDDGREIDAQRQLVEGKQRAAGRAEVPAARRAAPAGRTVRPAAVVAGAAAAVRANRATVAAGPADRREHRFRFPVRHPQHRRQRQRARGGGEEEVLAFGPAAHGGLRQMHRPNLALPRPPVNRYVRLYVPYFPFRQPRSTHRWRLLHKSGDLLRGTGARHHPGA